MRMAFLAAMSVAAVIAVTVGAAAAEIKTATFVVVQGTPGKEWVAVPDACTYACDWTDSLDVTVEFHPDTLQAGKTASLKLKKASVDGKPFDGLLLVRRSGSVQDPKTHPIDPAGDVLRFKIVRPEGAQTARLHFDVEISSSGGPVPSRTSCPPDEGTPGLHRPDLNAIVIIGPDRPK